MARRDALRDFQAHLAERLQSVREQPATSGWLAVECAGHGLLIPLHQAGEIFPVVACLPVPHTQPWFLGVANLRGSLHGVIDLAAFLGIGPAGRDSGEQARLVALGASLQVNAALLVDRLAGLRSTSQLTAEVQGNPQAPAFAPAQWRDSEQRIWQALDLATLAADERFLKVFR
jgi:twitching motility protein PilI